MNVQVREIRQLVMFMRISRRYSNLDVRLQMNMYCDVHTSSIVKRNQIWNRAHSTELVEHIWKKRPQVRDRRKSRVVDRAFIEELQSAGTVHGSRISTDEHLVGPNPRRVAFH